MPQGDAQRCEARNAHASHGVHDPDPVAAAKGHVGAEAVDGNTCRLTRSAAAGLSTQAVRPEVFKHLLYKYLI